MTPQHSPTATLVRLFNDAAIAPFVGGAASSEMNRALNWEGNNSVEEATQTRMGCDINNTLLCYPGDKDEEGKKKDDHGGIIMPQWKNTRSLNNSYYTQGQEGRLC